MEKTKIIYRCDKIIFLSICIIAFFAPVSKAIIEFFSILSIVFFIFKKILQRKGIPSTYLNFGIYLYAAISFISIFFSSNIEISARTFFCKLLQNLLFFFVIVDTLNTEKRIKAVIYIFFVSSLFLGIDGIYQHFTRKDFLRNRPDLGIPRIHASFNTPNDFACYLNIVLPFITVLIFNKYQSNRIRFILIDLLLLLLVNLILTVSRGAWLAFLAYMIFLNFWLPQLRLYFILFIILILLTKQFYSEFIRTRLEYLLANFDASNLHDGGSIERKIIWGSGWKMFLSRPVIGVGIGTFMFNFRRFLSQDYLFGPFYAHNCYLQIAAETGIIGLVFFLIIIGSFFYFGVSYLFKGRGQKNFPWYALLACTAAVLGFSVHMGVDTILYSLDLGMLFWMLLALGVASSKLIQIDGRAFPEKNNFKCAFKKEY